MSLRDYLEDQKSKVYKVEKGSYKGTLSIQAIERRSKVKGLKDKEVGDFIYQLNKDGIEKADIKYVIIAADNRLRTSMPKGYTMDIDGSYIEFLEVKTKTNTYTYSSKKERPEFEWKGNKYEDPKHWVLLDTFKFRNFKDFESHLQNLKLERPVSDEFVDKMSTKLRWMSHKDLIPSEVRLYLTNSDPKSLSVTLIFDRGLNYNDGEWSSEGYGDNIIHMKTDLLLVYGDKGSFDRRNSNTQSFMDKSNYWGT